jgi:hypothetical protein
MARAINGYIIFEFKIWRAKGKFQMLNRKEIEVKILNFISKIVSKDSKTLVLHAVLKAPSTKKRPELSP